MSSHVVVAVKPISESPLGERTWYVQVNAHATVATLKLLLSRHDGVPSAASQTLALRGRCLSDDDKICDHDFANAVVFLSIAETPPWLKSMTCHTRFRGFEWWKLPTLPPSQFPLDSHHLLTSYVSPGWRDTKTTFDASTSVRPPGDVDERQSLQVVYDNPSRIPVSSTSQSSQRSVASSQLSKISVGTTRDLRAQSTELFWGHQQSMTFTFDDSLASNLKNALDKRRAPAHRDALFLGEVVDVMLVGERHAGAYSAQGLEELQAGNSFTSYADRPPHWVTRSRIGGGETSKTVFTSLLGTFGIANIYAASPLNWLRDDEDWNSADDFGQWELTTDKESGTPDLLSPNALREQKRVCTLRSLVLLVLVLQQHAITLNVKGTTATASVSQGRRSNPVVRPEDIPKEVLLYLAQVTEQMFLQKKATAVFGPRDWAIVLRLTGRRSCTISPIIARDREVHGFGGDLRRENIAQIASNHLNHLSSRMIDAMVKAFVRNQQNQPSMLEVCTSLLLASSKAPFSDWPPYLERLTAERQDLRRKKKDDSREDNSRPGRKAAANEDGPPTPSLGARGGQRTRAHSGKPLRVTGIPGLQSDMTLSPVPPMIDDDSFGSSDDNPPHSSYLGGAEVVTVDATSRQPLGRGRLFTVYPGTLSTPTGLTPVAIKVVTLQELPDSSDKFTYSKDEACTAVHRAARLDVKLQALQGRILPVSYGTWMASGGEAYVSIQEMCHYDMENLVYHDVWTAYRHLHAAGVIHKDVELRHWMFAEDGTVRIVDLDVATTADELSEDAFDLCVKVELDQIERCFTWERNLDTGHDRLIPTW